MNGDADKDKNDPDYDALGLKKGYPEAEYWSVVKETIRRVFKKPNLDEKVDSVRKCVENSRKDETEEEKYRFYQTEPYNVAADITDMTGAGTEEQWRDYLKIKEERNFGISNEGDVPKDLLTPFRRPKTSAGQLTPFRDGMDGIGGDSI